MTKHNSSQIGQSAQPLSSQAAGLAMMIAAIWGGTPVAISFSVAAIPPILVAAIRFALAAVFMLFWCRFEKTSLRLPAGQRLPVLIAAFLLFLQISTFNLGTAWSNSSHASMLINTFVFWVLVIEHFVTRTDRLTIQKSVGLIVASMGVMVVLSVTHADDEQASVSLDVPTMAGDLTLLGSAFLLGIRIVYLKHALRVITPGRLIFWHDVVGVVMFLAWSAAFEELVSPRIPWPAMLGLLYQGILVAGLCFAIQAQLLRKYSASRLAVFAFATPLFGVLFAVLLRNDALSPWLLVSVVCVAAGILLVNTDKR